LSPSFSGSFIDTREKSNLSGYQEEKMRKVWNGKLVFCGQGMNNYQGEIGRVCLILCTGKIKLTTKIQRHKEYPGVSCDYFVSSKEGKSPFIGIGKT
jgi:hypothetical protein